MKTYTELSTAVHKFCTGKEGVGSSLTQGKSRGNRGAGSNLDSSKISLISDSHRIAYLLGKELYERLKQLLIIHLGEIKNEAKAYSNEALLRFWTEKQDQYTVAAKQNNHLFKYLNQHWVKREIMEGKKDIYDVYRLHLVLWEEVVVAATHTSVADVTSQ
jgi:cullin 1